MDMFLLYLMMQADSIVSFSQFACIMGFMIGTVSFGCYALEEIQVALKIAKLSLILSTIFLVFAVAFPRTKTIAVMVGGHYAIEATKSDTGKKIMDLVNKSLDKSLADAVKK